MYSEEEQELMEDAAERYMEDDGLTYSEAMERAESQNGPLFD